MTADPPPPRPDPASERLLRLEEHLGFTEHTLDQLSTEIAELNRRLQAMISRVDSLEARLTRLQSAPESEGPEES